MLNQVVIVGRLVEEPSLKETESEKKVCNITIATPRSYKNVEGIYETDFIDCVLWNMVAENTCEYCHKGDLIGIKGRVEKSNADKQMQIIAEKVTFLSSKKEKNN